MTTPKSQKKVRAWLYFDEGKPAYAEPKNSRAGWYDPKSKVPCVITYKLPKRTV